MSVKTENRNPDRTLCVPSGSRHAHFERFLHVLLSIEVRELRRNELDSKNILERRNCVNQIRIRGINIYCCRAGNLRIADFLPNQLHPIYRHSPRNPLRWGTIHIEDAWFGKEE